MCSKTKYHDMPHAAGRRLAARPGVAVATVHLESLDSERVRGEQLAVAARALGGTAHAVLMGDFNFDATRTWGEWRDGGVARTRGTLENDALPGSCRTLSTRGRRCAAPSRASPSTV